VDLYACEVWLRTEAGIAHYVEVGEAGESESLADASAACGFEVGNEVVGVARVFVELIA
jgi:hypothetical protein